MIDQQVFHDKKAAYYTLGCKLNFAETSTLGKMLAEQGVRKVLNAAALTYVAAAVTSLLSLLRLLIIAGRNQNRR